jgi:large repetitive protein
MIKFSDTIFYCLHRYILLFLLCSTTFQLNAQLQLESVLINGCGVTEINGEFLVLSTSGPVFRQAINITYGSLIGGQTPCPASTSTVYSSAINIERQPIIDDMNTLAGCIAFEAAPAVIPEGSTLMIFFQGFNPLAYNGWQQYCGQTIYVLFANQSSSAGGVFLNEAGTRYLCVSSGGASEVYGFTNTSGTQNGAAAFWNGPGFVNTSPPTTPACQLSPPPACAITAITVSPNGVCNDNDTPNDPDDDYILYDITLTFTNPPSTGTLDVYYGAAIYQSIPVSQISPPSYTFTDIILFSNGQPYTLSASFSANPNCNFTVNLTAPPPCSNCNLTLSGSSTAPSCINSDDGSITLTPSGGAPNYTYSFDGTSTGTGAGLNLTDLTAGSYNITVIDADGCSAVTNITINPGPAPLTPSFTQIAPICTGASLALPTTSSNSISGTWSPNPNNTQTTTYTFTPDPVAHPCANTTTMTVTVNDAITPTFNPINPTCAGQNFTLPATSLNNIAGSWSPGINLNETTTYTFTPNATLHPCATTTTLTVTVNSAQTPMFSPVPPICAGGNINLPNTSLNGIAGTWNPAINNMLTTSYTFTPNATLHPCANPVSLTVNVEDITLPEFTQIGPFCSGQNFNLPTASNNGITGTWSPTINNAQTTTYTFVPGPNQGFACVGSATMTVTINPSPTANVPDALRFCTLTIPPVLLGDNVNTVINQIRGGDPSLTVSWFRDAAATIPILNLISIFNLIPIPTVIYARVSNGTCNSATVPVQVTYGPPSIINNPGPQTACLSYTLPPITGINLPAGTAYYTGPNGTGTQYNPGDVITSTTSLYAYTGNVVCADQEQFTITIVQPPTANTPPNPLSACDDGSGQAVFNLSSLNSLVSGGAGTVSWFSDAAATIVIGNPAAYLSGNSTVYATVTQNNCPSAPVQLQLNVLPAPSANPAGPLQICDSGAGLGLFVLTSLNANISNGNGTVNWFIDPQTSIPVPNPNGYISGNTTVYATVNNGTCTSTPVPVTLSLIPAPLALTPAAPLGVCSDNPNLAEFNLSQLNDIISGGNGSVSWFNNPAATLPISNPDNYLSGQATVYATVSDGICTSLSVPVVLQINPLPEAVISVLNPLSCSGAADASIQVIIFTGIQPYNYDWNIDLFDGLESLSGLPAGTYELTLTDGNNCTTTTSIILSEPAPITFSCSQLNPASAQNSNDGSAQVNIQGGSEPYTITWTGAASGSQVANTAGIFTINNLLPGVYSIAVTDNNGCTETCSFNINSPDCNISITTQVTNPGCNGTIPGSIVLTINNATGPLNFTWNIDSLNGQQNPSGLLAGTYAVTVAEAGNCSASTSLTLVNNPGTTLNCTVLNSVSAFGASDGAANILFSGGAPGYTLSWSGPITGSHSSTESGSHQLNNLPAGTYQLTLTDAQNCSSNCSFIINNPACNLVITASAESPSCHGGADGAISLNITNGGDTLSFDWNLEALDGIQNPSNLVAGTYIVSVTDEFNCSAVDTITLSQPTPLSLNCAQLEATSAAGATDGRATISFAGGTAPYIISWAGAASGQDTLTMAGTDTLSNLPAGSYAITLTDANNCSINCSFVIQNAACNFSLQLVSTNPTCHDANNGSILISMVNGSSPFQFNWNIDSLDGAQNATGLRAGIYSITVTDNAGCSATATDTLISPQILAINCASLNPTSSAGSADGSASVTVDGGTAPYTIQWTGPANGSRPLAEAGPGIITNLPAGSYSVTVTDNNGCQQICSFNIASAACTMLLNGVATNPNCHGATNGAISLNVSSFVAPLQFNWNIDQLDGQQNPTGLGIGVYSVTVTDATGCLRTASFTLTQPQPLNINCIPTQAVSVPFGSNGMAVIQITGGVANYSVSWNGPSSGNIPQVIPGNSNITGLRKGDYTVSVTDANGCTQVCSFTIDGPDCAISVTLAYNDPTCFNFTDGVIISSVFNAFGAITFDWNVDQFDGIPNPGGLGIGDYSLTVTDTTGCSATATVTLTQPDELSISCSQQQAVSTSGGSDGVAGIQISGGTPGEYTISWSGSSSGSLIRPNVGLATINGLSAGTYSITVSDINSCFVTCIVTITEPVCTMTVSLSGTAPTCHNAANGSINTSISQGLAPYTFEWNVPALNGIQNPTNLSGGSYSLTLTDAQGCRAIASITIQVPAQLILNCTQLQPVTIIDGNNGIGSVQINGGTAPYQLTWTGPASGSLTQTTEGPAILPGLSGGNYAITVTDANGCTNTCSFFINSPNCNISLSYTLTQPECRGDSTGSIRVIVNNATGTLSFTWSREGLDGQQNPLGLPAGNYQVTVTDDLGCSASLSVQLIDPAPIALSAIGIAPNCFDPGPGTIRLQSVTGGNPDYAWSFQNSTFSPINTLPLSIPAPDSGTVALIISDANDCLSTFNVSIPPRRIVTLDLGPDVIIELGDSTLLRGITNVSIDSLVWTPTESLRQPDQPLTFAQPLSTTTFTLRIFDADGCSAEDDILITVVRNTGVFIPNAFSPNDDGFNDKLNVFSNDKVVSVNAFSIFDRWGNQVYSAGPFPPNDLRYGWDGRYKDQLMHAGVYVFYAEIEYVDGATELIKGEVTLIR